MSPEELEQFIHRELRSLPPRKAPTGFEARFQARLEARQTAAALSPEQLEQLVHRELRALPPRKAPRTLESRVFSAIEQRAAVAWWHKSWSYWPTPVKSVFAVVATLFAGSLIAASFAFAGGADLSEVAAQAGERLNIFVKLYHVGLWVADFGAYLFNSIPPLWLYGGLAFISFLYVTFFGLGAAVYRTLYRTN